MSSFVEVDSLPMSSLDLSRGTSKFILKKKKKKKNKNAIVKLPTLVESGPTPRFSKRQLRTMQSAGQVTVGNNTYVVGPSNIADPRNQPGGMTALGRTIAGRSWALRALHPCGEDLPADGALMPDMTSTSVCGLNVRMYNNVVIPAGYDDTSKAAWAAAKSWSICIIGVPGLASTMVLQASIDGNFDVSGFSPRKAAGTVVTPNTWIRCNSIKYENNMVMFHQSSVASGTKLKNVRSRMNAWRVTSFGFTCHLNASSTTDQGRTVSVSIKPSVIKGNIAVTAGGTAELQLIDFKPDEAELVQQDPKSVTLQAKKGVYVKSEICAPVVDMKEVQPLGGVYILFGQERLPEGDANLNYSYYGTIDTDWTMPVTMFLGIDPSASVDVKVRSTLEIVASAGSDYSLFQEPSPLYDPQAIERVAMLTQTMGHAYEARFNDLGGLLGMIANGLKNLGIPIISDIAGVVSGIL